ncbi:SNF2 family N-terminal domain-containing protein [Penicillium solitum]|uniref:SNF2 family N-terminal domain-containing protein n=1 Tax=Penicillium solitum TaxID=60172 RepID=UPI0032C47B49|nr:SNF2 family N-terminal domain-containing protein [Penicillium solitum]
MSIPQDSLGQNSPFQTEPSSGITISETSVFDEEICLGAIIGITAQLDRDDALIRRLADHDTPFLCFSVLKEGNFFLLEHEEEKFARLNKQLCTGLSKATSNQQIRLQAYIIREDAMLAVQKKYGERLLPIEINVYAPLNDVDDVGAKLSKSHIFLQPLRYGLEEKRYMNPHVLRFEGQPNDDSLHYSTIPDSEEIDPTHSSSDEGLSDDVDEIDMDDMFGVQLQHIFQANVPIDRRIKTDLLQHQKEAIGFISQREHGQTLEHNLWDYNDTDEDEPFYQHVFNGERRAKPQEASGGILADEMGLGKSLVTLSVIAGSLNKAEKFAGRQGQEQSDISQKKNPTQATLIVVPSTLLIDNWVNEIRKHTFFGSLIVLDEAHYIRNRATKQFQAVVNLSSQHRWCLTGTPIQNSIEDLGALVAFLRVPILDRVAPFRKFISVPTSSGKRDRFHNLQTLLHAICIRRTRDVLNLPEPTTETRKLPMSSTEKTQYKDLLDECRTKVDMAVSGRRNGKVNSTVLESLLSLRLFCNNGKATTSVPLDSDEALSYLEQLDKNVCIYCSSTIFWLSDTPDTDGGIFLAGCRHLVCHSCIPDHRSRQNKCPCCDPDHAQSDWPIPLLDNSKYHHPQTGIGATPRMKQYPTKLLALLSEISQNPAQKCVVFSSWKKTLYIVAKLLSSNGIKYSMIEGSLSLSRRLQELQRYQDHKETNVLLMTLGTGAVGLNLTTSSRIYLLEPQWNPSIEAQAIGRALRLGQVSNVTIVRYIMEGTVEESNVLSRQRKKLQLTKGGFQKSDHTASDRIQSLLDLFQLESSTYS